MTLSIAVAVCKMSTLYTTPSTSGLALASGKNLLGQEVWSTEFPSLKRASYPPPRVFTLPGPCHALAHSVHSPNNPAR